LYDALLLSYIFSTSKIYSLTPPRFIEVPVPSQESDRHVFMYLRYQFCLFLIFFYLILKLFRQC